MQSTAIGKTSPELNSGMPLTKLLRIMKISALLLLIVLQTAARPTVTAQVTLKETGAPLEKVLKAIKKQSDYGLSFDEILIRTKGRPVVVNVNNVPVEEALTQIFKTQDQLTYSLNGKIISVKEKKAPITPELQSGDSKKNTLTELPLPPPTVHGRITNEKGDAVGGVSISIKGGKIIGVTNDNGEFTLTNVADNALLVFSAVNTETLEIKLNGRTELAFSLKTKTSVLDEVQMIAYGSTSKRLQTGNVTTVKGEDIAKQPVSNPLLALQGRIPGLVVTQNTGIAGGGVTVRLQGRNGIDASVGNDPLIIIDGVPYPSQMFISTFGGSAVGGAGILGSSGASDGRSGSGNPLNYINPSDIESIDVLKDADATAIYGSRAANGAILITTKKGVAGKTKFDLSVHQGWNSVGHKIDFLNTQQYLAMRKEAFSNDGVALPSIASNPANTDYDVNGLWDQNSNTDWQKVLIGGIAKNLNINATVSGGTANTQFLIGGLFNKEGTVFPGDFKDEKGNLHFSLTNTSFDQKFRIQLSASYMVDNNQLPLSDFTANIFLAPNAPKLYKADGSLNWELNPLGVESWDNPFSKLAGSSYEITNKNLIGNMDVSYKIFPNLTIKTNLGYNNLQTNELQAIALGWVGPSVQPFYIQNYKSI